MSKTRVTGLLAKEVLSYEYHPLAGVIFWTVTPLAVGMDPGVGPPGNRSFRRFSRMIRLSWELKLSPTTRPVIQVGWYHPERVG
jgi:hypothetical protein